MLIENVVNSTYNKRNEITSDIHPAMFFTAFFAIKIINVY